MIKLRICLFDEDCEEFPTETFLYLNDDKLEDHEWLLRDLQRALQTDLKAILEPQGFRYRNMDKFSVQVDCREGIIRLRDKGDVIGEPGNIAMMINLRLVE